MHVGNSPQRFQLSVQLHSFFVIFNTVNRIIHVGRLKDSLSGKGKTILVSSRVFLHYKLRLHRGGILSKHHAVELEYVRLLAGVKVSPLQSEMGTVLLLNLSLEVYFFYVVGNTNRVSTEMDKHVEKILL